MSINIPTGTERIALLEALASVESSLGALGAALRDQTWPVHFDGAADGREARCSLISAFKKMDYSDDQEANEVCHFAGVAAISPATERLVGRVNGAKAVLRQTVDEIRNRFGRAKDPRAEVNAWFRNVLRVRGRSRWSLLQAWRHIVVLPRSTYRISYTWAETRVVKRVSVKHIRHVLNKFEADTGNSIDDVLALIDALEPETPLARVRVVPPHPRLNIVYGDNQRKMFRTSLPVVLPMQSEGPLPFIRSLSEAKENRSARKRVVDRKLKDNPLIPFLSVFEYLDGA